MLLRETKPVEAPFPATPAGIEEAISAAPPGDDVMLARQMLEIGRQAALAAEYDLAVRALRRGLEEDPPRRLRLELLTSLGAAEVFLDPASARIALLEAHSLCSSPEQRGELVLALTAQSMLTAGVMKPVREIEAALKKLPDGGPVAEHLLARRWVLGHFNRKVRERVTADARRPAEGTPFLGAAIRSHDAAVYDGTAVAAIELARRAIAELPEASSSVAGSSERTQPAMALMYAGDLAGAGDDLTAQIAEGLERRSGEAVAVATGLRAGVRLRRGDLRPALSDLESLDELPLNLSLMVGLKGVYLVETLRLMGRLEEASSHLAMLEAYGSREDSLGINLHLETRAQLQRDRGQLDDALVTLELISHRDRQWGIEVPGMTSWRAHKAEILAELGRQKEALMLTREAVIRARRFGSPIAIGIALRAHGLVLGPAKPGLAALRESVEVLRESPARLELARSLVELGLVDKASPRALDEGGRLAGLCGATPLELRVLQHRIGPQEDRDHTIAITRPASLELSPGEEAVVVLAARGLSNREAADQLGLSRKTVEAHLSKAYRKLRIGSRGELVAALRDYPLRSAV